MLYIITKGGMSYAHIEEQLAALGRRIDSIERQLRAPDPTAQNQALSFENAARLLGWVMAGASLLVFLIDWAFGSVPQWALVVPAILGLWLALRDHAVLDISDSTLALLHEDSKARGSHASASHKQHSRLLSDDAFSPDRIVNTLGMAVGFLILALIAGWGVVYLVPTTGGQLLIVSAVLVSILAYSLISGMKLVSLLVAAGLYALLASSDSPILGLFLMAAVSVWLGVRAFRSRDWNLALLVVIGTYAILARWVMDPVGLTATRTSVSVITGEMLLLAAVTFALPLAGLRRTASERLRVRWLIGLNTFGYTCLAIPLTRQLIPGHWAPYVVALLFSGLGLAGLAWQAHGKYSYAKYFILSSAAGFLVSSLVFLDPALITLVWLMGSIILLTAGFVGQSYTFRLAGLMALVTTVCRYLAVTLPAAGTASPIFFLRDRVWIGLLLAIFLAIAGMWYRDLRSRGSEDKYRLGIAGILYSLAALVMCGLVAVEAVSLSH